MKDTTVESPYTVMSRLVFDRNRALEQKYELTKNIKSHEGHLLDLNFNLEIVNGRIAEIEGNMGKIAKELV